MGEPEKKVGYGAFIGKTDMEKLDTASKVFEAVSSYMVGRYRFTSGFRPDDSIGYHRLNRAVDIAIDDPIERLFSNLVLAYFWPGGIGVDDKPGNYHTHVDSGPRRRWAERGGVDVGRLGLAHIVRGSGFPALASFVKILEDRIGGGKKV